MPRCAHTTQIDADGWHAYADEAGALRTEHTQSRGTPPDPVAEPPPRSCREMTTTISAPPPPPPKISPPSPLRCPPAPQAVESADPTLDADINRWFADDCDCLG